MMRVTVTVEIDSHPVSYVSDNEAYTYCEENYVGGPRYYGSELDKMLAKAADRIGKKVRGVHGDAPKE